MDKIEIVSCLQLEDSQVCYHLTPLALHPRVARVWIVRSRPSAYASVPKAEYRLAPAPLKPLRWLQMARHCRALARRPAVRAFVSFNPFPYGWIGGTAARRAGKAVHYGFIGSDWYLYAGSRLRRLLLPRVSAASLITATGAAMRAEMIDAGLAPARIAVLPHAVDLARYTPGDPAHARYTAVYVGKLVPAKRIETILDAFARVHAHRPAARLALVGRGPAEAALRARARRLGIDAAVEFTGFVADVAPILAAARFNIIASQQEGFPFALVEGICCGAIPITTPVGTIPDHLRDGDTAVFFPVGDAGALATRLLRLLDDDRACRALRENVLRLRPTFGYDHATRAWDPWLRTL
jgi:glycosyltransferase involved in cell wall biosynthesis